MVDIDDLYVVVNPENGELLVFALMDRASAWVIAGSYLDLGTPARVERIRYWELAPPDPEPWCQLELPTVR